MFASCSGGNRRWAGNAGWPVSGGVSLGGRSVVRTVLPAKIIMLEVTEEETFPGLESDEQHLVPALPLIICAI